MYVSCAVCQNDFNFFVRNNFIYEKAELRQVINEKNRMDATIRGRDGQEKIEFHSICSEDA
jgi:hypothetical protein